VRIAPYSAIQFFSFGVYKGWLMGDKDDHSVPRLLAAGALAGMTSSIFCYPLDLVRSILTVQTSHQKYRGMVHAMTDIYKTQGVIGLYKGLYPTLLGIAPYIAVNFTAFDLLKKRFLPQKESPYFDLTNLGLGACAGATAVTLTYPTDVVRRRMQLSGFEGLDIPKYKGLLDCLQTIYRTEGMNGFFRGLVPCYLKVIPSMAIAFMTYERLKNVLGFEGGRAPSS